MGAWHIEGFNSTTRTEEVFGTVGSERVSAEHRFPTYKTKAAFWYNKMQKSAHRAYRAVTLNEFNFVGGFDLKGNRTAMTSPSFPRHQRHGSPAIANCPNSIDNFFDRWQRQFFKVSRIWHGNILSRYPHRGRVKPIKSFLNHGCSNFRTD